MSKTIWRKFTLADKTETQSLFGMNWLLESLSNRHFLRNNFGNNFDNFIKCVSNARKRATPFCNIRLTDSVHLYSTGDRCRFKIIAFSRNSYPFRSLYLWSVFCLTCLRFLEQLLKFKFYSNLSEQHSENTVVWANRNEQLL